MPAAGGLPSTGATAFAPWGLAVCRTQTPESDVSEKGALLFSGQRSEYKKIKKVVLSI